MKVKPEKPLVSYIIPCFNQTRMLYESLTSVMLSYSGPKEIFVINDFSTEPGWKPRLRELQKAFPDIRIIHHEENKGLSASRNHGLNEASGEYIQFLDSDDFLSPGKVDYQLNHFRLVHDLSISVTDYLLCDEDLSYFYTSEPCLGSFTLELKDFLYKWERGLAIPIHCGLFRRDVFSQVRFDETLFGKEDWVFWCKLAYQKRRIAFLNTFGAIYRQHQSAMTKSDPQKMGKAWLKAASIINEWIEKDDPNFLNEAEKWFQQYYQKL